MPGDAPTFATSESTTSTILLIWKAPKLPNGIIISYTLSHNLTSGNITAMINASSRLQHTITGLDAYTYYECTITAETKVGSGPAASIITQTTQSSEQRIVF